ncbi:DUF58 domain-containing protein [Luteimonas sp. YGD11-2]|uniref:DUF58 domain-containing protein n=1 Tax=Luteimonas sp. YGD11-2 TaxID=2508168 RepID=UPI001F51075B|nr:DUF58 domain-containing protein [Luteimonas sp. YGD11-2]
MAASARAPSRMFQRLQGLARPRAPETLPARLDRRRIYVLPTAFGLFFFALLLTMGVGALNYNNNPALLLCLLLAGTALASLLHAHLQLSGLAVQAVDAEAVAAGRPLALRVHVRADPGRPRRGLEVRAGDTAAALHLDDGAGEAVIELPTMQRGWLDVGRLRISTTRPLGLARAWSWVWPEAPMLVYPAPETHGPPLPEGAGDNAQARLHASGDDVHHLRNWRRGDSRRAIAWKPSARRGQLLVREYEQPQGADVVIDWRGTVELPYEARIRRLARWVDEAERDQRRYVLRLPGQPAVGPARGALHRHACLRALALLPEAGHG